MAVPPFSLTYCDDYYRRDDGPLTLLKTDSSMAIPTWAPIAAMLLNPLVHTPVQAQGSSSSSASQQGTGGANFGDPVNKSIGMMPLPASVGGDQITQADLSKLFALFGQLTPAQRNQLLSGQQASADDEQKDVP